MARRSLARKSSRAAARDCSRRLPQASLQARARGSKADPEATAEALGITEAPLRELAQQLLLLAAQKPSRAAYLSLAKQFWKSGRPEPRLLAIRLLAGFCDRPSASNWKLADRWAGELDSPQLADALGRLVLAPILAHNRSRVAVLSRWARSAQPWRRRAALEALHRLSLICNAFIPETLAIARILAGDSALPVQEALGRALSRCARLAPSTVRQFLLLHRDVLSERVREAASNGLPTAGV